MGRQAGSQKTRTLLHVISSSIKCCEDITTTASRVTRPLVEGAHLTASDSVTRSCDQAGWPSLELI